MKNRGWFVAGTDTDAGKSVVTAWLMQMLGCSYWKPVQSGLEGETDTEAVRRMSGLEEVRFLPETYVLNAPMSPHESARRDGVSIEMARFALPESDRPLLVEGAGGLMVPLNDDALMIDLMVQLDLPVLLVARTGLGTINHTLLSLEAMRSRGLTIDGVVLSGAPYPSNTLAIERYGRIPVLAEIPWLDSPTPDALAAVRPLIPDYFERNRHESA
ncbi:MAG: dethiobiotin synthase [Magnetococcales bacterium]|nr:dethiobiotin synthase [Magnetococcales bacterium]